MASRRRREYGRRPWLTRVGFGAILFLGVCIFFMTFNFQQQPASNAPKTIQARRDGPCAKKLLARLRLADELQPKYRAILWKMSETEARSTGNKLDALPSKSRGPLHCSIIAVKDNIDTNFLPTTAGSKVLLQRMGVRRENAVVIKNLLDAGAVILFKANMDEFALDYKTFSSVGGQTLNAINPVYFPGGSSGGSAVAVKLGIADAALGTDTGGSIRIPAAFNGVYGLRPTHGAVSLKGVVPLAHSRDTVGPFANTPEDIANVLSAIMGKPGAYAHCTLLAAQKTYKIGSILELHKPRGKASKKKTSEALRISGLVKKALLRSQLNVVDLSIPEVVRGQLSKYKTASWYEFAPDIAAYLSASNSRTLKTLRDISDSIDDTKLQRKLLDRIKFAHRATSSKYAAQVEDYRRRIRKAILAAMRASGVDVLAYPTYTAYPGKVATGKQPFCENNRLSVLSGFPSLSVPVHPKEMVGMELLAKTGAECDLIAIAQALHSSA